MRVHAYRRLSMGRKGSLFLTNTLNISVMKLRTKLVMRRICILPSRTVEFRVRNKNHNKIATVLMSVSYYKAIWLDLKAAFPPGTLSLVPHSVKVVNQSASRLKGKKIP